MLVLLPLPAHAGESVRSELARLQKENGLRLVTLEPAYGFLGVLLSGEAVNRLMFESRTLKLEKQVVPPSVEVRLPSSISPDGSEIALNLTTHPGDEYSWAILVVVGFDGHPIAKYPYVYVWGDSAMCWSPDSSKIALNAVDPRVKPCKPALRILDLKSGALDEIDDASNSSVTNQCWSPNGRRLVYTRWGENDDTDVRVYDLSTKTSVSLEKEGWGATWSPDGKWIALRPRKLSEENGPYRLLSPDRSRSARSLKYRGDNPGPLWWSPDSRFVAYVSWAGLGERFLMGPKYISSVFADLATLDLGHGPRRLRVKRLDDGRETPVLTIETGTGLREGQYWGMSGPHEFQWLQGSGARSR